MILTEITAGSENIDLAAWRISARVVGLLMFVLVLVVVGVALGNRDKLGDA